MIGGAALVIKGTQTLEGIEIVGLVAQDEVVFCEGAIEKADLFAELSELPVDLGILDAVRGEVVHGRLCAFEIL